MINTDEYIDIDSYSVLRHVGNGIFTKVYEVKSKKTNEIYAASIYINDIDKNPEYFSSMLHRVSILLRLSHPALIKFYGISQYDFNKENHPIILSEFMRHGTMCQVVDKEQMKKSPTNWNATKKLINIYGIASCMQYLHSKNIIHKDLMPETIFEDENFYPKIRPLDYSTNLTASNLSLGTPLYLAPEIAEDENPSIYSDIFSYGMTVYFLMTGNSPNLSKSSIFKHFQNLIKGDRPQFKHEIGESYRKLIVECWSQNPSSRIKFDEIVYKLKTDRGFITPEIDEDEYFRYIKSIELNENLK